MQMMPAQNLAPSSRPVVAQDSAVDGSTSGEQTSFSKLMQQTSGTQQAGSETPILPGKPMDDMTESLAAALFALPQVTVQPAIVQMDAAMLQSSAAMQTLSAVQPQVTAQPQVTQNPLSAANPVIQQQAAPDTGTNGLPVTQQLNQVQTQPQMQQNGQQAGGATVATPEQQQSTDGKQTIEAEAPGTALFAGITEAPVKVAAPAPTLDTQSPNFAQNLVSEATKALPGDTTVQLKLTPESMGEIELTLTRTENGQLTLTLRPTTEAAAGLLSERAAELSTLLRGHSQNPVTVEILNPLTAQQAQEQQEHAQKEGQSQQQGESRQEQPEEEGQDFLEKLRLGLYSLT